MLLGIDVSISSSDVGISSEGGICNRNAIGGASGAGCAVVDTFNQIHIEHSCERVQQGPAGTSELRAWEQH